MNHDPIPSTATTAETPAPGNEQPSMVKQIDGTTFDVYFHFSRNSRETFTDKVLRLIQTDTVTSKN